MGIWDTVIETGIKAAGSYLSESGKDSGGKSNKTEHTTNIVPSTTSDATISDFDVLYNANAVEGMYNLTEQMNAWTTNNQEFFQSVYQPYQESIISTNQGLLPTIEKVAGQTLELNAKDMVSNENLKAGLRQSAIGKNVQTEGAMANLRSELANVPTEQERVGQALASVEGQFKGAGRELARDFASRGQAVSQASRRDLAFQKAEAKAGAAGAAAEAARAERINAAQTGVGAELRKTESDVATRAQEIQSLTALQGSQQSGLATPQVGGVQQTTGLEGAEITSGLSVSGAQQKFGTREKQDVVQQVQKGTVTPALTSGATGQVPGGVTGQGTPATDENGALITPGSTGAGMNSGRQSVSGAGGAMADVIRGMFGTNPR